MLYLNDQSLDYMVGFIAILCVSLLCSAFIAARCGQQYASQGKRTATVVRFLGLKAIADSIYAIEMLMYCSFLYQTIDAKGANAKGLVGPTCVALGFFSQCCALADMSLNFCIAFDVYLLLLSPYTYDTKKFRNIAIPGVLVLSLGSSFWLLGAGKLGNSGDGDCWLKNPTSNWSWFLYGPAYFYWCFCFFACGYFVFRVLRETSVSNGHEIYRSDLASRMLKKMLQFTVMFICCWSLVVLRHLLEMNGVHPDKIPPQQQAAATFFAFSIGIWDVLVWYGKLLACPCITVPTSEDDEVVEAQGERRTDESFRRSLEFRKKVAKSLGNAVDPDRSSLSLFESGNRQSDDSSSRPSSKRTTGTAGTLHGSTELPPI